MNDTATPPTSPNRPSKARRSAGWPTRLCALVVAATAATAAAAAPPATPAPADQTHLVPARDFTLAAITLAGNVPSEPVLLFDAQDADAVRAVARSLPFDGSCTFAVDDAGSASVSLMQEIAGEPCRQIADSARLSHETWPDPERVVVFPAEDDVGLIRAAGFAAATGSALLPIPQGSTVNRETLGDWTPETIFSTSPALVGERQARESVSIADDAQLLAAFHRIRGALPGVLILANPRDHQGLFAPSSLSLAAIAYAAMHRSPIFAVPSADPGEIERYGAELLGNDFTPGHILLVADELGMKSHRVPDPVLDAGGPEARGGGVEVRVELFSGIEKRRPQAFPVGRVVATNAVHASLAVARRLHLDKDTASKPVIFLTNADEIFALGETISRTTVQDLRNLGVRVHAYYRDEVTPEISRQALGQTDVLVWEGHPRDLTLEQRGGVTVDRAPRVAVLQGCYTLDRSDPFILIENGTQAIVATSAAIYSAPGSGFARALFDAVAHDDVDLGTAVRNARNYLLALAALQEERGHSEWHKTWRAALAFTLWGDPTYRVPITTGAPAVKPATWEREQATLRLRVPHQRQREVAVEKYRARAAPRAMFGGLVLKEGEHRRAKEMFSAVLRVGADHQFVCAEPGWNLISLYAPATETLTVLARPDWDILEIPQQSGGFAFRLAANETECLAEPTATSGDVGTERQPEPSPPAPID